jgi:hypothetical protein
MAVSAAEQSHARIPMESLAECVDEYRRQVRNGVIPRAYRAILDYVMGLRTHFANRYPDHFVSGSVYPGCMDITYFAVVPEPLKRRHFKAAVVSPRSVPLPLPIVVNNNVIRYH